VWTTWPAGWRGRLRLPLLACRYSTTSAHGSTGRRPGPTTSRSPSRSGGGRAGSGVAGAWGTAARPRPRPGKSGRPRGPHRPLAARRKPGEPRRTHWETRSPGRGLVRPQRLAQ
jgi:hypothetical protein